jgi:diguanylate cyclase (GGDEF)-like protein
LTDVREASVLTLTLSRNGESYCVPQVYIGSSAAVMRSHVMQDLFTLALAFLMLVIGIIAMALSLYLRHIKMWDARFADVAAYLFICAVWCLSDSAFIQNTMSAVAFYLSFYSFMMMAVPILHFVRNTGNLSRYRVLGVLIALFYFNVVVQTILDRFKLVRFVTMLPVTHILLIVGVSTSIVLMVKEYLLEKDKSILFSLAAFAALGFGGCLALVLYWLFEISFYAVIFECGILIFISILLSNIIIHMTDNLRFRMEADVYKRLAKEDRLTGLRNRLAFDQMLEQIEQNMNAYPNALLMFLDVDCLKTTNDYYGHHAGDELILSAARCISSVFSEDGLCYRIGGDEFCVILLDSTDAPEQWNCRFDIEIQQNNQNARYPLSISRGYSMLKNSDGRFKTVSDWKYDADQKMYQDKVIRSAKSRTVR